MTATVTTPNVLTVVEAMSRVMSELGPIAKDGVNAEQHFRFRGIDQFMNALNPVMVKHGVLVVPRLTKHTRLERPRNDRGGVTVTVIVEMDFDFYGPAGDRITASTAGEGNDVADKATAKAMAVALKYALMDTFLVTTERDTVDADAEHVESVAAARPVVTDEAWVADWLDRVNAAESGGVLRGLWPELVDAESRGRVARGDAESLKAVLEARKAALDAARKAENDAGESL
jgi:hypothetical protein